MSSESLSRPRLIPLAEPDLRGREEHYLSECVRTGWVSSVGPYVTEVERRLADLVCCRHAVATASGTTALQLLLAAMGVGAGRRVIVPDWTFAATANAVIHAGAAPVLVDVDRDHWGLNADLVEGELAASQAAGHPIAAVVAVDPIGLPADMDALSASCRRYGVPLIEDAAGAIGSTYKGRPAGGLADAAIFSFNGNKLVTGGGGGAILTNCEDWARRARHLSTQARSSSSYEYDAVGFNYRLTNLNAAVIVAQLERLEEMVVARQKAAAAYTAVLVGRGDIAPPPAPNWAGWNGWMYVARTASAADAGQLVAHLESLGIGGRPFWQQLSRQRPYAAFARRLNGVGERLSGNLVSLPCGSALGPAEIERVVDALRTWRGNALPS